jgi:hypothetical protein
MAPIDDALEYLRSHQDTSSAEVARLFNIDRSTLSRRWRGVTTAKVDSTDQKSHLNHTQQLTLVAYLNKLTLRGLPPTQSVVRLFAQDICHKELGKNWVRRFIKTHANQLTSEYLSGVDTARRRADNIEQIKLYFELVSGLDLVGTNTNILEDYPQNRRI